MARPPKNRQPGLYTTSEVATKLGLDEWRVKSFSKGEVYGLPPSFQVGTGRGSRRLYTDEDIVRIAVAYDLLESGFGSKVIGEAVKAISPPEVIERIVKDIKAGKNCVLALADGKWSVKSAAEIEKVVHKVVRDKWEPHPIFILNLADFFDSTVWRFREKRGPNT